MPSTQTTYAGVTDVCSNCNGPAGHMGTQLSSGENGRPRYLCQSCAALRKEIEWLEAHNADWENEARMTIEMLQQASQSSLFEPLRLGSRASGSSKPDGFVVQAHSSIHHQIENLNHLVSSAESRELLR